MNKPEDTGKPAEWNNSTKDYNPIVKMSIWEGRNRFGQDVAFVDWWMDHPFEEGKRDTWHFGATCASEILRFTPPQLDSYFEDYLKICSFPDCYPKELIPEWIARVKAELGAR